MTIRLDSVTICAMSRTEDEPRPRRSFANGNAPDTTALPLEGWILRPVHWWYW